MPLFFCVLFTIKPLFSGFAVENQRMVSVPDSLFRDKRVHQGTKEEHGVTDDLFLLWQGQKDLNPRHAVLEAGEIFECSYTLKHRSKPCHTTFPVACICSAEKDKIGLYNSFATVSDILLRSYHIMISVINQAIIFVADLKCH